MDLADGGAFSLTGVDVPLVDGLVSYHLKLSGKRRKGKMLTLMRHL